MLTTKADEWFSRFIRLFYTDDDGVCYCFTCGKPHHPKDQQCGHFVKRQYKNGRFSEVNAKPQCGGCNKFKQGNDVIFRKKLVEMYGEDQILLLESGRRDTRQLKKYQEDEIARIYKEKAEKLLKEKGIKKWWS